MSDLVEPSAITRTWPKARVEHTCCECGRTIGRGEKYERVTGIWDGSASSYTTCLLCSEVRDWANARDHLGVLVGGLIIAMYLPIFQLGNVV